LAWLAGTWQFLHHMQIAVLILFATREIGLSTTAIGAAYAWHPHWITSARGLVGHVPHGAGAGLMLGARDEWWPPAGSASGAIAPALSPLTRFGSTEVRGT